MCYTIQEENYMIHTFASAELSGSLFNPIIIRRTKTLIIAAKKHQIEMKYVVVNNLVNTQDIKMVVPRKCILLTLETKAETTVGIK